MHKENKNGMMIFYKIGSLLPIMMMLTIIGLIYSIYMGTYIVPLITGHYQEAPIEKYDAKHFPFLIQIVSWNELLISNFEKVNFYNKGIILGVCVHVLILFFVVGIIKVKMTKAGEVSVEWINEINQEIHTYIQNENAIMNECIERKKKVRKSKNINSHSIDTINQSQNSTQSEFDSELRMELNLRAKIELIEKQGKRFCKYCVQFKPKRCHHCRQCSVCWLKMDHHCQWLNSCVGQNNYKIFINMISYAWTNLCFIVFTYSRCFYDSFFNKSISDVELFLVNFNFYFSLMMLTLVSGFCLFHFWLISMNKTTLEYCESKKYEPSEEYSFWANFLEVFGTNPFIWPLPIST